MSTQVTLNSQVRFADYFVICGLDLTSGLELDVISGDIRIRALSLVYFGPS